MYKVKDFCWLIYLIRTFTENTLEGGGKGNTTKIRNGLHHMELKNAWGVVFFPKIQRFVRQVNAGEGNCPSFFLVT